MVTPRRRGEGFVVPHRILAAGQRGDAILRSTYCRIPPCRKYSTSFGVSIRQITGIDFPEDDFNDIFKPGLSSFRPDKSNVSSPLMPSEAQVLPSSNCSGS